DGIAYPREHVCDWIGHISSSRSGRLTPPLRLPAALGHAGHVALKRELAEAQAAQRKLAHVRARPAAQPAAVAQPDLVFRRLLFLRDLCSSSHDVVSSI